MATWNLDSKEVCRIVDGKILFGEDTHFSSYGTDTRQDLTGQLFIPLKGDSFDAHDFFEKAVSQGAAGLLTHKDLDESLQDKLLKMNPSLVVISVKCSLQALQSLANDWRHRCSFKVIGITGTNGKTTCKEFVSQILSQKYNVYASKGSLNNHWGVPFTLMNADENSDWVICEMGMNSPGEIAKLCEIAEPNVVGVTFVGRGHLEGMGSIEKVALEKSQIYVASPHALKVFNLDNFYTERMKADYSSEDDVFFGNQEESNVFVECVSSDFEQMSVQGRVNETEFLANLSIYGEHNVTNLMMSISLCLQADMNEEEVIKALPSVQMAWGRNQVEKINDMIIVFDGYNANPESMDAFLSNASKQNVNGNKHLILGEMLELGDEAGSLHEELGSKVKNLGFKHYHFFGPSFKHFQVGLGVDENQNNSMISVSYEEGLALKIKNMLQPNDAVFIKGSRGVHLERFLDLLRTDS